jgi:phosphomannomutase/phosphoglucomutase
MLPKPRADLKPNTADFERLPLVKPTGFREYDARWLFLRKSTSWASMRWAGRRDAIRAPRRSQAHRRRPRLPLVLDVVKQALMTGLLAGGCEVHDIGLALSPMAYYAQFALDVEGVAMVTASHNDNGWTGIKMGAVAPADLRPRRHDRA